MTWQPGSPVITPGDHAEWQAWRKTRKLKQQRERRQRYSRIDYYPSEEARMAIEAARVTHPCPNGPGSDISSLINALILRGLRNKIGQL